ncbi:hypothetical protein EIN_268360 [Entamoeba invadens IP1]|uniref:Uncharacterized protein n=1 Tax=Entamoeba invadens IP1 TaxID=370355 RepID=A0A0A1UE59_ENTIV|nr:hypothetical protein EIN_268360 [Entamoeba invadens IP1]ELP91090.1 hypothetical protein EIN_268360 [Entamoeba invadens IP1]|eukprot:XP_004257861.1 hypothetical protein EIN_268360 [Entamoeba invadens IP1]
MNADNFYNTDKDDFFYKNRVKKVEAPKPLLKPLVQQHTEIKEVNRLEKRTSLKLLKTNVVVFCDIPQHWRTEDDVRRILENQNIVKVSISLKHMCCVVCFATHKDAIYFKISPPEGTNTMWSKESWMMGCNLRDDGVCEIPHDKIPKDVHVFNDGTYSTF